jgi:hypothetical protein
MALHLNVISPQKFDDYTKSVIRHSSTLPCDPISHLSSLGVIRVDILSLVLNRVRNTSFLPATPPLRGATTQTSKIVRLSTKALGPDLIKTE